ncbi:DUF742 domain-containing protein [Micromonospora harpali]|uniref:DUF742 domain-containing protein n=3 Tax=Micromonospora TaxID=1873 RepID=A0A0D0UQC2_9ACTN|nr:MULTISPECIES: DUF742 domain-containing protein [Micromonospora]MDI5939153.1 DUF742 domain-containing protein [Micromonospora sp. DH15]KIR61017.1 hypothetical protein TK50_24850 [Micromonospora haikouensis]MBB5825441.1 hypothetical protein [Micromonospora carbonacea]MDG4814299.1 DUF742 domain-containing protein [Micromonospora sp. WMMD956]OON28544.1 hypothetical protein BSA16_26155 [Micromonospora sp. Rc5]
MTVPGESTEERWVDDHAGPVVRPYAVTGGRARPVTGTFDLISLVTATRSEVSPEVGLGPEHLAIVALCQRIQSVAEVAAHLDLPVGTIRVLLGDLMARDLVQVREPRTTAGLPDDSIFEAVINGLRAL